MAETSMDITGQEIMTADKVTLRINAVLLIRFRTQRKRFVRR
jgi:regulator of protease activity HflC (stomatin/prohibitin superfamily)